VLGETDVSPGPALASAAGAIAGTAGVVVSAVQGVATVVTAVGRLAAEEAAAAGSVSTLGWAGDRVSSKTSPVTPRTAPATTLA
jgi:hypothetical protein